MKEDRRGGGKMQGLRSRLALGHSTGQCWLGNKIKRMVTGNEGGSFGWKLTGTLNVLWLVDDAREGNYRSKFDEEARLGQPGYTCHAPCC